MPTKSHTLWLLAALTAPAAHFSGCGWFVALLAAAALLPLTLLPADWEGLTKPHALLQILWLGLVTGAILKNAAVYWPSGNDLAVPLTLLTLAAITKPASAPRVGTLLAFCLVLPAIPVAASAAATGELFWLQPTVNSWPMALSMALLLPALPAGKRSAGILLPGLLLTVALAALTQSILSPAVAAVLPDAFYQMARTLGHMEPILAAALTLSFFAMTSHNHTAANGMAMSSKLPRFLAPVLFWLSGAAGMIWFEGIFNAKSLILSGFLWILTPFLRAVFRRKITQMNFL